MRPRRPTHGPHVDDVPIAVVRVTGMATTNERRADVLTAIARAGERGVSGEVIADALGCSRAAVHRHVEALRRDGIAIEGVHGGYVLGPGADPVVPAMVEEALTSPLAGPVHWVRSTGSTNDDVAARAREGAPEGLVIGADVQTSGRGRRGRAWVAGPNEALLFSVLLRPPVAAADVALLPIVVAVAVAEALHPESTIVWPNDVIVDHRKICGILCESAADESGLAWAVVGIGVNVRSAPPIADARWSAGSLVSVGAPVTARTAVASRILSALGDRYRRWLDDGPDEILAEFSRRDALAGTGVVVQVGEREIRGTASGLDGMGRLRVVTATGEEVLGSGEVVRVAFPAG